MKLLNQQLKALLEEFSKNLLYTKQSRREYNKLLRELQDNVMPLFKAYKKRIGNKAIISATESMNNTAKKLMAMNMEANITILTNAILLHLVSNVVKGEYVFVKIIKGKRVAHAWNMNDAIDRLGITTVDNVRKRVIASLIDGTTPADTVRNMNIADLNRVNRRHIKTLTKTIMYQATVNADMKMLETNRKYFDHYMYVTHSDDKVDDICKPLHGKTWKHFSDIPKSEIPQLHINCRCSIEPIVL